MRVDIRDLECSVAVQAKINGKHHISVDDVWHACENARAAAWHDDPERGRRLLVAGPALGGRPIRVILYPVDAESGTWRLATAF